MGVLVLPLIIINAQEAIKAVPDSLRQAAYGVGATRWQTICTTRNDLQAVACSRYPEVQRAIDWLHAYATALMTGSGACVFAEVPSEAEADRITKSCPPHWKAWKVRSLTRHPLYEWLQQRPLRRTIRIAGEKGFLGSRQVG